MATHADAPSRRVVERALDRVGYLVLPLLRPDDLASLRALADRFEPVPDLGFHTNAHSSDREGACVVDREAKEILSPRLAAIVPDYEPVYATFAIKRPGEDSVVPMHQDWTIVDEDRHRPLGCWVPVTPVTAHDGPLRVVEGSHRWVRGLRGSPAFPTEIDDVRELLAGDASRPLDVPPGSVVLHDGRLVHGSHPNRGTADRIALTLALAPRGAQLVHHYRGPTGQHECFEVDASFFPRFRIGDRPGGVPTAVGSFDVQTLTPEQVDRYQRRARWPWRPWRR